MRTAQFTWPLSSIPSDLRLVLTPSELRAYWDLRPSVSGAQASAAMSATLAVTGATLPAVTMTGPLSPPRQVRIDYPVGGARGTATYSIDLGNGPAFTGTTSATPVDIGGGNTINFSTGTNYTARGATGTIHQTKVIGWSELTGLANATLVDTLSGAGHRYEAFGMANKSPSLYMWTSCLNNDNGVPGLVTGLNTDFEIWAIIETWSMTESSFARCPWAFVNQTDTTKNFIDTFTSGPAAANPYTWGLQRKDNGSAVGGPFTSTQKAHASPSVARWRVTAAGMIQLSGSSLKTSTVNLHTANTTTINRFLLGQLKLGTGGFTASANAQSRISALAITQSLAAGREIYPLKALSMQ